VIEFVEDRFEGYKIRVEIRDHPDEHKMTRGWRWK
jgi:hypothetical protein